MNQPTDTSPYHHLPHIIALFSKITVIAIYSLFFLMAYLTYEDTLFTQRLQDYHQILIYLWIALTGGLFLNLFLFTSYRQNFKLLFNSSEHQPAALFLLFLTLSTLEIFLKLELKFIHFITFLSAVYALLWTAKYYAFESNRLAWRHPTSAGAIVQGTIAIAAGLGIWFFPLPQLYGAFVWILIVVLLLETLTVWSRFKFLSQAAFSTRQSARMMLGSHLSLFGIRFIFGLIMPLVYLLWYLFSSALPLHPVVLMVLVGELSERILFFITSEPESILPIAEDNMDNTGN